MSTDALLRILARSCSLPFGSGGLKELEDREKFRELLDAMLQPLGCLEASFELALQVDSVDEWPLPLLGHAAVSFRHVAGRGIDVLQLSEEDFSAAPPEMARHVALLVGAFRPMGHVSASNLLQAVDGRAWPPCLVVQVLSWASRALEAILDEARTLKKERIVVEDADLGGKVGRSEVERRLLDDVNSAHHLVQEKAPLVVHVANDASRVGGSSYLFGACKLPSGEGIILAPQAPRHPEGTKIVLTKGPFGAKQMVSQRVPKAPFVRGGGVGLGKYFA
jgi:hypothetical protein